MPRPHTQTKLLLPFEGPWLCFWGGDTPELNWHHNSQSQRYAYDFVIAPDGITPEEIVAKRNKLYRGGVLQNENSLTFRQAVFAPAAGSVVIAHSCTPDNKPSPDLVRGPNALGNHIVLKHTDDEFTVLGHLSKGSVAVQPGEEVASGQKIAECGNSGTSTDPHLHFHMQDSPEIADYDDSGQWGNEAARAIDAGFLDMVLNRGGSILIANDNVLHPQRGDLVTPLRNWQELPAG